MANAVKAPASQLEKVLNHQVANFGVLYIKLHNFHWYVKGPNFFTLHIKLEELYNETTLHFDAIAERLLTLHGQPLATMAGFLKESDIKEAQGNEKAEDMVRAVVADFNLINDQLKEGMEIAEKAGDETTGDLLLSIHASLEKHTWMLEAFLGNS
ncbi:Dps family protein [Paenibacillus sp. FSL H8-0034]|uniref:Dps family protein n=1 Tax=Paenibacillus sp. FSL H8-0034 TaxID=2954671 RepID=UPI0030F90F8D